MTNNLGEFLESLRKQNKLSLRAAGEKSGLSHSYIRDLELGVNRATKTPLSPSLDALRKLAVAYDYPIEEIIRRAGISHAEENIKINTEEDLEIRTLNRYAKSLTKEQRKRAIRILEATFEELFIDEEEEN